MDNIVPILIIAALIALNALFVAAEFAIVGAPRLSIERLAASGNRQARLVADTLNHPRNQDRYIATAQLGITAASLGLGMYGEHLLAQWIAGLLEGYAGRWIAAHALASVIAVTILTYFHIVLGEMVPKSLALQYAERTVLWIAPLMRAVQTALSPLVIALNGTGNWILKLLGIDRAAGSDERLRTAEDLAHIVEESVQCGLLSDEPGQIMQGLLDFSTLTAGEVMVPRVHSTGIPAGATADSVCAVLRSAPHTGYPVYEESMDRIVGMLHVKDIVRSLAEGTAIAGHLREVPFVPESARMDEVLAAMRATHSQMAVVMDEHGGTAGIITMEDLFEEVVGEITEDAAEKVEIEREGAGCWRVAGTARLEEVGEALGLALSHPEVDSVSGIVLALLGRPPEIGDTVIYENVRFEVIAIENHGVAASIVESLTPPDEGERTAESSR